MITDYWVITQLLAQLCSLIIITTLLPFVFRAIRSWNTYSYNESQIFLERKNYLASSVLQFTAFFQIISLLIFISTVNNHLPHVIKGAMCATGTLSLNAYGYIALLVKLMSVFLYGSYLFINYLDNKQPNYPLTPKKYYLIIPIWIMVGLDFYFMFQYYSYIKPDIIATCCSVSFLSIGKTKSNYLLSSKFLNVSIFSFIGLSMVLSFLYLYTFFKKNKPLIFVCVELLLTIIFVYMAHHSLKYYFVKYIYGLPSHTCLFDTFLAQYNYVGYIIFVAYYLLIITILFVLLLKVVENKIDYSVIKLEKKLYTIAFVSLLFTLLIPICYWVLWKGEL